MTGLRWRNLAATISLCALAASTVGPNYHRPSAPSSPAFKEAQGPVAAGWQTGQPGDGIDKGAWWSMYHDAELDWLETQVATANQTVKEYEAAYREAHQVTAAARASFFPTVGVTADATRTHSANGVSTTTGTTTSSGDTTSSGGTRSSFTGALEASWVPDLWGKTRRTVESDRDLAQASAADLANARLAAQATLAQDYFELRTLDEQATVYKSEIASFQQFLDITKIQYQQGTQAQSAVLTAQTQLLGAQAAMQNLGVARAAMEHAIAVLVGKAPSELSIPAAPTPKDVPEAPASLPSVLLQRRPDIAAAERRMASENALVGVATAAYFPTISLSGEYGTGASSLGNLFSAGTALWSLGGSLTETLLDFGARHAQVQAAKAAYDQQVATYRQTVLTAFQGVEDELAALHVYAQEYDTLLKTEESAHQTVQLDLAQYKAGTIDYTTVITAQATELSDRINRLTVLQERLQASALLVEDLGGGWAATDLPKD